MKTVTLISLPAPFLYEPAMNPPIGLCSIGTVVKHAGHDVNVIDYTTMDYDYDKKEYLFEIPNNSDVYGISCVSSQFKWLKEVVKHIKDINPSALVVSGGPHSSSEPKSCLNAGVDIAFNGEGEYGFLDLVNGKPRQFVLGSCYKCGPFETKISTRAFIEDLNTLPFPDFSLFDMDRYKRKLGGKKAFHIMTLRGCPYRCNFCDSSAIGGKVRYIDKERIIRWIDYLIDTYDVKSFVIYDDTFTINSKRVQYFCKEFKKRKIKWRCWSRANSLRDDDLKSMKDAGIESVAIGIESGDSIVLKNINKCTTVEHNKRALNICKKNGVPVRCSLMFGNPGETRESLQNTINFIEECQPDEWNLSVLMPTPGSEFWNHPEDHGLRFDKDEIIKNDYKELNRSGGSSVGYLNIKINSMPDKDILDNLNWFVSELDRVCPRTKIRDTIQKIRIKELS